MFSNTVWKNSRGRGVLGNVVIVCADQGVRGAAMEPSMDLGGGGWYSGMCYNTSTPSINSLDI